PARGLHSGNGGRAVQPVLEITVDGYVRGPCDSDRGRRRSHTGRIFEAAKHEPFGSPVDHENAANHAPATEDGLSSPSIRPPRTGTAALFVKVTGEGAGPTPDEFSRQRNMSHGAHP
ncbi:MAG: hypothetical protein R6V12_10410, partial [Candidatus Hydrogenedentota bacterium]